MAGINDFDIGALENEVLMALDDLYQMDIPDWISDHRGAAELYADVRAYGFYDFGIPRLRELKWFSRDSKDDETEATEKIVAEIEENAREAISFLTRKEIILKSICPALSRVTDDAFALATQITPVIVTLGLSGVVAIPLNPLFIALVTLMVTRMGVAKLCGAIEVKR
jgi:hypothetical protein